MMALITGVAQTLVRGPGLKLLNWVKIPSQVAELGKNTIGRSVSRESFRRG
jgi:hypothetical protein